MSGLGVDIIEISRVKEAVGRFGDRFLNRIYTEKERAYCIRRKQMRYPELAARFAAKEAYAKSIGTGMRGIHYCQIEVANDPKGKPYLVVNGKEADVRLSLSHSRDYAVAVVVNP